MRPILKFILFILHEPAAVLSHRHKQRQTNVRQNTALAHHHYAPEQTKTGAEAPVFRSFSSNQEIT